MARRGQDDLLQMLHEIAAMQRANADRLARVERCLSLVTEALPALAGDIASGKSRHSTSLVEPGEDLSGDERRFLLEEAAEALELDIDEDYRPRRMLDS